MTILWRESSHSASASDDTCVELGRLAPEVGIGVRDSKAPDEGHLPFPCPVPSLIKQDSPR